MIRKDPQAKLDYTLDWAAPPPVGPWLVEGDTITASTWSVPAGLTMESSPAPSISTDGKKTTVWLSGGTHGEDYPVVNHITTAAGRADDRTLNISVRQR